MYINDLLEYTSTIFQDLPKNVFIFNNFNWIHATIQSTYFSIIPISLHGTASPAMIASGQTLDSLQTDTRHTARGTSHSKCRKVHCSVNNHHLLDTNTSTGQTSPSEQTLLTRNTRARFFPAFYDNLMFISPRKANERP